MFTNPGSNFIDHNVHLDSIIQMQINSDGKYLCSISNDGTMFFHYIREFYEGIDLEVD